MRVEIVLICNITYQHYFLSNFRQFAIILGFPQEGVRGQIDQVKLKCASLGVQQLSSVLDKKVI